MVNSTQPDGVFTLTNGTDIATANIFDAPMVYTPAGNDRINSLQDDDILTGLGDNPTLNITFGNDQDAGDNVVTPTLHGIETINMAVTGNTNVLDARFSDGLQELNITKVTASSNNQAFVQNIGQKAAELSVSETASVNAQVGFFYVDGILADTTNETAQLGLTNVKADWIVVSNNTYTEGFEKVNLNVSGTNDVDALWLTDLEQLTVAGSGNLTLADTTQQNERVDFVGGNGINIGNGIGIRSIDMTAFTGTSNVDITNAMGVHNDPANSGATFYSTVTGGQGNDTFWTNAAVTGESATKRAVIDGGAGQNTLRSYANINDRASITNIQTLELREQGNGNLSADMDAFDDNNLATVIMRDEILGANTFTLNDVGATLAASGNIILKHPVTGAGNTTVVVDMANANGAADTVAVSVQNDRNTDTTFNYTLSIDGDNGDGDADNTDGAVENVTINDRDSETNTVTLTKLADHTNTLTLVGGEAGDAYTVNGTIVASTVEASAQISDLRLTVGKRDGGNNPVAQVVNLGSGNDILTYAGLDDFNGGETITDVGGIDTVRAAFSKSVDGAPSLEGIERLHIVATANTTIDMSRASTVQEVALMSNVAVDGNPDRSPTTNEPFNLLGVDSTDIITLKNTALSTLNFFGDNDTNDVAGNESLNQVFNGVTLENNSVNNLTVVISSALDVEAGAQSYTLGQITAHGVKAVTVAVANEETIIDVNTPLTTINNIWAKDLESLTVSAQFDVNLGVVSGNPTNNNLKTLDASAVGGDFTASVIALGDNAVVTLGNGDNTLNALGSAGKGVSITSGTGDDDITGTAQSDTITVGAGNDIVAADRGDNVISSGAGDDTLSAKDGNDTYAVGSGIDTVTDNFNTRFNASLTTNTVTGNGTIVYVNIDDIGDGSDPADVMQYLAVGAGSDLTVSWLGTTMNATTAVLNGRLALDQANMVNWAGTANSDLIIVTDDTAVLGAHTFNGGAADDVLIIADAVNATGYTFNGGAGNDAFVGSEKADQINGGTGADKIVLQQTKTIDNLRDVIVVNDGDSLASGWDQVVGYDFISGAPTVDVLDLVTNLVAADTVATNGTNVGDVKSHAISDGVVTFDNEDIYTAPVVVGTGIDQLKLTDALAYLATALNGTSATVAFAYDRDGDGAKDDTFVYQDGAADTVIQLVGLVGVDHIEGLATTATDATFPSGIYIA